MTMGFVWFWIVAVMIVAYVVLDGFDLGVGILHFLVARTEQERQLAIRSIGPVWDGNEVWLLAGGGTLYFAFPLLYASAFSGFYLALMIVLWLLIMRGLGVELRMHMEIGVWRAFFDGLFFISSLLLAIFYGAALANVIRGVPLGEDGYFFLPLWTNWRVGPAPGIRLFVYVSHCDAGRSRDRFVPSSSAVEQRRYPRYHHSEGAFRPAHSSRWTGLVGIRYMSRGDVFRHCLSHV